MAATIYYDSDANPQALRGLKVAVIGYGSQGHAHALNLKESGVDVRVGLHENSRSWPRAEAAGLRVTTVAEAAREADIVMMLTPDTRSGTIYQASVKPHLTPGKMLMFAHGFAIRFGQVVAPEGVDVAMVAPKSPGHRVRELYVEGAGTPALIAVHQDATGHAWEWALAYAYAIGTTRAGVLKTTFEEETETDLFGEQAVLCGGVSALVQAGFETLVEAGYQPEVAYFECLHELKLIVDLMYRGGLSYMRYSISDTAEHGDYSAGPKIITAETRTTMRQILADIQSGAYAEGWIEETARGGNTFLATRRAAQQHPIEDVGLRLRRMMPWLDAVELEPDPVAVGD